MCLYKYGLVVGRFQMLHLGHAQIIETALDLCDTVVVYIGSSQESWTFRNPFSYELRKEMISETFGKAVTNNNLIIRPLPDIGVGNNDIWGRYVLGMFEAEFHTQPDLYVTGCEKNRLSWFSDEIAPKLDELRIARKRINISGSQCRDFLRNDKRLAWRNMVPPALHQHYEMYYNIITNIKEPEKDEIYEEKKENG